MNIYEDMCKDILGTESYFLFTMDKLVSSLMKTLSGICNDSLTREIVNLYLYERSRQQTMNEKLYLWNFLQLIDNYNINCFRMHYSVESRVMSLHLIDLPIDPNRRDYLDTFKEYIDSKLGETYSNLIEDNKTGEDPFTIFLERNVRKMKKKRKGNKPILFENNLVYKVVSYNL
jgi:histone deacetylase complex regulatory component SIN3